MGKRKILAATMSILIILSFSLVTLWSFHEEPSKPQVFSLRKAADGFDDFVAPNITTRTFSLVGGKATFGIQFVGAFPIFGNQGIGHQIYLQWVNLWKINQSTILGLSNFSIIVDKVNESISENNTTIGGISCGGNIGGPHEPPYTITDEHNRSVQSSFFFMATSKPDTVYGLSNCFNNNYTDNLTAYTVKIVKVDEFNFTFSIEVTPLLELGPYFEVGSPVWITQNFIFPYHGETRAFVNSSNYT